jgi:transposase
LTASESRKFRSSGKRLNRRHYRPIAWTQTRQTNGFIEAINGLFQAAKRKARGYARFETMRTVMFLIAGKLDFSRFNEHAPVSPVTHSVFKRANF